MSNYVAFVPCRAGSTRIKNKWRTSVSGQPLYEYTFRAIELAESLSWVIFSSDSSRFLDVAQRRFPTRASFILEPYIDALEQIEPRIIKAHQSGYANRPSNIVLLQLTSPARSADDIDDAITMHARAVADRCGKGSVGLVSVTLDSHFTWIQAGADLTPTYNVRSRPRSQDYARLLENGAIYIAPMGTIIDTGSRCACDTMIPYQMGKKHLIEIDSEEDIRMIDGII